MNYQNIRRLVLGLLVCAGVVVVWQRNATTHPDSRQSIGAAPTAKQARLNSPAVTSTVAEQKSDVFQTLNDPDAAPVWAVKFGGEFWRHHSTAIGEEAAAGKASNL